MVFLLSLDPNCRVIKNSRRKNWKKQRLPPVAPIPSLVTMHVVNKVGITKERMTLNYEDRL